MKPEHAGKTMQLFKLLTLRIVPLAALTWYAPVLHTVTWVTAVSLLAFWLLIEAVVERPEVYVTLKKNNIDKISRPFVVITHVLALYLPALEKITFQGDDVPPLQVAGFLLLIAGALLRIAAIRAHTRNVAARPQPSGTPVITNYGIYRIIIYPHYLSLFLLNISFSLILSTKISLIAAVFLSTISIKYRTAVEERVLSCLLGDIYRNYINSTSRWYPRLGGGGKR